MRELGPRPTGAHPDLGHWRRVRAAALVRDQGCRLCGTRDELEVHHRSYTRWGRERLEDLTTLCRGCHDLVTGAQMRRRDARRVPPLNGRVAAPVERLPPLVATAPPTPARAWRAIERLAPQAIGLLPPPARGPR
jgi:5-methylcytosine-specific restriction endonuclease McrA